MKNLEKIFVIATLIIGSFSDGLTQPDLIGYWPLDGDAADMSSNNLTGTIRGSVSSTADKFGNPCGAMHFDGGYIEVDDSPIFDQIKSEITVCAWAKIGDNADSWWVSILNKGKALETSNSPHFRFQFTKITFALTNKVKSWNIDYDKDWHHWAMTFDGNFVNFYMDGLNIQSFPYSGILSSNDDNLEVGRDITGVTESFTGDIDELMIFNRSLTFDEINDIYNKVPVVSCDPPLAQRDFAPQNNCYPATFEGRTIIWAQPEIQLKDDIIRLSVVATDSSTHRLIAISLNGGNWDQVYLPGNRTIVYDRRLNQSSCNYLIFKSINKVAVFALEIDNQGTRPAFVETETERYVGLKINN